MLTACGGGGGSESSTNNQTTISTQPSNIQITKGITYSGQLNATHSNNANLTYSLVSAPNIGELDFNSDGQFTYTVSSNEQATSSQFSFKASAGSLESATTIVTFELLAGENTAPTSQNKVITSFLNDVVRETLPTTDIDNDSLTFELIENVSLGKLEFDESNGEFIFFSPENLPNPEENEQVQANFSYRAFDGNLYSSPAIITININPQLPYLNKHSYQLFGSTESTIEGSFYLALSNDEQEYITSADQVSILVPPKYGELTINSQGFSYKANNNTIEQTSALNDFVILSLNESSTSKKHIARYELKLSGHNIQPNNNQFPPLEPSWQNVDDFPELLDDVLSGADPFDTNFVHSEELFIATIKALDTLALYSKLGDEHIEHLSYYIRAYIYNVGSENLTSSQLDMLDTAAWRISDMTGFYGLSESSSRLHQAYSDVIYSLTIHENKYEQLTKHFNISIALYDVYARLSNNIAYAHHSGVFEVTDLLFRMTRAYSNNYHSEYDNNFTQRLYNEQLLATLERVAQSNVIPIEGDYYMLDNLLSLGGRLWLEDSPEWQTSLNKTMEKIAVLHVNQVDDQQAQLFKSNFYSNYLKLGVGYYNPDLAQQQCLSEYKNICYIASEQEILPNVSVCDNEVELRYNDITSAQITQLCHALDTVDERFHQLMQTNYQPVADDNNDYLVTSIFDSAEHYGNYGNTLYDISTNNGGLYLEGNPADIDNQAHFFAYQQTNNDQWWVWNFEHEYTHYLDGRYIKYGGFEHFPLNESTWWTEGLAEYIAWGDDFPRGLYEITNTAEESWPTINEIIAIDYYSSNALVYSWSYSLHRFIIENYPQDHLAIKECLFANDIACYRAKVSALLNYQDQYHSWLQTLVAASSKQSKSLNSSKGYDESQYLRDQQQLDAHSQMHKARHKSRNHNKNKEKL